MNNSKEYIQDLLNPYVQNYFTYDENGFITWRLGTGKNVELLYLYVEVPRKGTGTKLLKEMLSMLKENPPYSTVFGFTRTSNAPAIAFYEKMGFSLSRVEGVYADGEAMVFSAKYEDLKRIHNV